jgi:hypothetical protein
MNTRINSVSEPSFLRLALIADAAVSAFTGLAMILGAGIVDGLLGLPATLLHYAGLSLIPFAAVVGFIATRERPSRPAVWAVIAYNALWAVDSIVLIAGGWLTPTLLGYAFTVAQAIVVSAFAELQYVGMRKWRTARA